MSRALAAAILLLLAANAPLLAAGDRLRVIIETDAGGDPDDEQSLVRFLLYANEWDVEGIVCTRPHTKRDENRNKEPTGLDIVRRQLKAYAAVYDKLKQHGQFPHPDELRRR